MQRLKVQQTYQAEDLVSGTHLRMRLQYLCVYMKRILDHSNGDVAVDFYHHFREDIKNVKNMGFDAFRFSISWPRVIPNLRPFVTIFHWDTPQALEYKYGGFLSPNIVDDYRDYADLLFDEFGDRVKYWMTFNEPWALSGFAYDDGVFALGIRSLLNYTKNKYDDLVIYITENGVDNANNETQPISDALKDQFRIDYYQKHMWKALESLNNDDVKLGGYFAWSYLDNFEWNIGYTSRFGLYYVDYKTT
ncbi:hypothetical protein GH714_015380 [Hevea brasiliensis]|uniref:Beta-glucosidase n=1 Tax=Hevea brasiliensis TaxID=3981 RepID=A0A6A6MZL9_HEVBR|nr:hypothetical protein GH714_015380 [Hevea brasiliensis]